MTTPSRANRQTWRLLTIGLLPFLCWGIVAVAGTWHAVQLREAYLPQLEAWVHEDPNNSQLQAVLGARLAQAQEYKAAARSFEAAIAAGNNDPLLWLTWAAVEPLAGATPRGLAVLDAGMHRGIQRLQEAKERVLRLGPRPTPVNVSLAICPDGPNELLSSLTSGSVLNKLAAWWGRRHPEQSGFATREEWANSDPQNAEAQRLWGEALLKNRSPGQAEVVLRHAVSLAPQSAEVHADLADAYRSEGLDSKALQEYTICLQLRRGWNRALVQKEALATNKSSPRFVDVAKRSGIRYRWSLGGPRPYNILQTIGNGCAFFDYNNDGNVDILLVGSKLALYQGDGRGHFTDVTHETGLDQFSGRFLGCAVGDYDNDGYEDLYISAYRGGMLLHNEHGSRFKNMTELAGISPQPWGTSCAFADVNNDGKLDLYICNYVKFGPDTQPQLCDYNGHAGVCSPEVYEAERGALYLNDGNGRFHDSTDAWAANTASGKALGVAFADYEGSGRQGGAIANDMLPGDLLENLGGRFRNVGKASGTAFDSDGRRHAGMGIDWGDYNNDGRLDLAVTTFQNEVKSVYRNEGGGRFSETSASLGLASRTLRSLGFGVKWIDYDNDGWLDLALANGHVNENIGAIENGATFRQPAQLFRNVAGTSFIEVSSQAGDDFQRPIVGRGLATGDFDNDGRLDLLIVDSDGAPMVLHNETQQTGHWLSLLLQGTRSNRDGIGALVTVDAGELKQVRRCGADGSYLSASDRRVHFGLGPAKKADRVEIRWPSGKDQVLRNVNADRMLTVRED